MGRSSVIATVSGAGDDRPRGGRPPATSRAELERVAFCLFGKHGFDETSIEDITAAAGIARRTFFRYYPSKLDLVWGDFDGMCDRLRQWFGAVPAQTPMMEAIHQAVLEFNRLPPGEEAAHRRRLGLILGVPSLLANSTLRFAQWRAEVAAFAARRLGLAPHDLRPQVIGYSALGAALAAYEQWLRDEDADLMCLLDRALGELATGFDHHGNVAGASRGHG
jgi:TetR/AcrR family transcriptional regulator, regulator of mycofactocin system